MDVPRRARAVAPPPPRRARRAIEPSSSPAAGSVTARRSASAATCIASGWSRRAPAPTVAGRALGGADEDELIVHVAPRRPTLDRGGPRGVAPHARPRGPSSATIPRHARGARRHPGRGHASATSARAGGAASRQGRLAFSWRLILAPPEALETVVIHELCHLRVFGHGPRSWPLWPAAPDHGSGAAGSATTRRSCTPPSTEPTDRGVSPWAAPNRRRSARTTGRPSAAR